MLKFVMVWCLAGDDVEMSSEGHENRKLEGMSSEEHENRKLEGGAGGDTYQK